ncbi:MAG: hypothetical protein EBZ48_15590 [Proteobacteria bacterium]|nr:hypothetical protein [Pseudomonadota bacterium]
MVFSVLGGLRVSPSAKGRSPWGRGSDRPDLNDIEVRIVLFNVVDAVVEIDAFFDCHELDLVGLPVFEDEIKGKHGAPF